MAVPSALDRVIPFGAASTWQTLGWVAVFVVALASRLMRLDQWALDGGEAARAYDAWVLFRGQPSVIGEIPRVGALLLLLETASFFLFGVTDVTARIVPALAGLAIVALPLALRRGVGGPAALGMAALAALSPTLVYASRVVSPEVVVAALTLAAVACLARLGEADATATCLPAIGLGIVVGAVFATAPSATTVALTLMAGIALSAVAAPQGVIRNGLRSLRGQLPAFLLAAVVTAVLLFTHLLSAPAGIGGVADTLGAWWQLLAGTSSGQPVQLFLLALVVYEPIAIAFAIAAVVRDERRDATVLFAGWAAAAFAIWSFSAGREPGHAIHVALPLVLLAGSALGNVLHQIDWSGVWRGAGGILVLAMLGILTGVSAAGILFGRTDSAGGGINAVLPPVLVLCLVVVPLAYLVAYIGLQFGRGEEEEKPPQTGLMALLTLALLLGAFGLRSAILLSWHRADAGTELLAQRTATLGTLASIEGFLRLSRDVGVEDGSARDPTGSHSLSIALERDVQWPYVWYFREFPDLSTVEPGMGAAAGAQVVIAANDAAFADTGYGLQSWPWQNTVPQQYLTPDMGSLLWSVIDPREWVEVWHYLLFRDGVTPPIPQTVAVGLTPELAQRVAVRTGPYDLGDRPGPGTEPGQFNDPIGVAVGADGTIAVVDSGNGRVQRFDRDGDFLGSWGGGEDEGGVTFARPANGLGPTGITISADGLTWVADTWGHRVVALDASGAVVQVIGGETIDTGDDPARVAEAGGQFFGPRGIAVSDAAMYITDTGNERVQQFTRDGAFVAAWGGYGAGPDQLIEPVGIALGPDGNVYVADSGNARIAIFTPAGEPVAQWPVAAWPPPVLGGLPPAFQPYLAFDADGNLYATASNAGQVLVFDRAGTQITDVTQVNGEHLAQPIGVAVAPDGEVLLTDVGTDTVVTYTPPRALSGEDFDIEDAGVSSGP